jgi:hypothetical protein
MATLKEQQQTLDNIKGPRYYHIQLWGYGAEHAYASISKEAYDFWKPIVDEHGDNDLCNYLLNAGEGTFDFENIDSVPPKANFLSDDEEGIGACSSWYEMPNEFEHIHAVTIDNAQIEVNEVDGLEYSSKHIETIIEHENVNDWASKISEETDYETEILDSVEDTYPDKGTYIVQMLSMEKGTFFDGIVETVGEFDPKKLKIQYSETTNGEDVVRGITYDGVEVDNNGGDTNGKGFSAAVWKQEY